MPYSLTKRTSTRIFRSAWINFGSLLLLDAEVDR